MKRVHILHNPGAGDHHYTKDQLISLLGSNGYDCGYSSTKDENWKNFSTGGVDILLVAGGDGTVKKVAKELIKRGENIPICLIPMGTANNIAHTLDITGSAEQIIGSMQYARLKPYDIGLIKGIDNASFMLESFGYGIFPYLMLEMKDMDNTDLNTPEKELQAAQQLLHKILHKYEPRYCELKVDGSDHSGHFLLAEIMNIRSIGPNLFLSPYADPGDGEFEVVLVPEKHKEKFIHYLERKLKGHEETYTYHTLKGKKISISWEGTHVHVDDKIVKIEKSDKVKITLQAARLGFLLSSK